MKKMYTKVKNNEPVIKRFDTKVETIERQLGVSLGVRGDMKFGNYLKRQGYPSLAKMLKI